MANDLISLIVRVNLALAVGVVVVLALRLMVRRAFGARIAYAFWLLPVLAAGACFLPPRIERLTIAEPLAPVSSSLAIFPANAAHSPIAEPQPIVWLAIWCVGVVASLSVLALRQGRFSRALGRLRPRSDLGARVFGAESNVHGPAVIGVLRPIIVTPADFDDRFSDQERRIVLAHERAHLAQGDPLINAFVVTLQCANWFNPFVHLAARALRLDQELAADAAVLATAARRPYAEAILKTQIMAVSAPLGAAWPPNSAHSLKERIAMLKRTLPNRTQRLLGVSAIAIAAAGVCAVAWAAQPAHVVIAKQPNIARADAAPFVEPPVTDASQLAGAAQSANDRELASAQSGEADVTVKSDDASNHDNADEADNASDDASGDADADSNGSNGAAIVVDADHARIAANHHLSPQDRARIRAAIAQARVAAAEARTAARVAQSQAVREAMAQSRVAIAEAATAGREAQAEGMRAAEAAQSVSVREAMAAAREAQVEGMRAAREAQAQSIHAAVAAARAANSPEMQAEIRAMAAEAAQMARDAHLTATQRAEMRAEMRAHADRLRELSRRSCVRAHSDHQGDDDHDQHD